MEAKISRCSNPATEGRLHLFRVRRPGMKTRPTLSKHALSNARCKWLIFSFYCPSGYGNLSPKTSVGKLATILYAMFGIPLMLLYMATIGRVLSACFKYLYSKICRCVVIIIVCVAAASDDNEGRGFAVVVVEGVFLTETCHGLQNNGTHTMSCPGVEIEGSTVIIISYVIPPPNMTGLGEENVKLFYGRLSIDHTTFPLSLSLPQVHRPASPEQGHHRSGKDM